MKTFSIKPVTVKKKWIIINATGVVLGRLATYISIHLRGKHLPYYTPNIDIGDNIIITNVEKIILTGKKMYLKKYYWHTGYPGGIKNKTAIEILKGKFPERLIKKSVERMMPNGPLGRKQMKNLYLYPGDKHPHSSQKPEKFDFISYNKKNKRLISCKKK